MTAWPTWVVLYLITQDEKRIRIRKTRNEKAEPDRQHARSHEAVARGFTNLGANQDAVRGSQTKQMKQQVNPQRDGNKPVIAVHPNPH
ncbi:hypothetical protein E2C01_035522 [Portunus trituberculatus]|uniref:Uncharacterized protein n=1 Tax=Portunus trituberculatus TaxID=210409 RepID=A0A5B7F628_PORTR|nr:hypothetical protein [Portunus trituberculatus]